MERAEAERLARRWAGSVYRLAYARAGNRADAEDVMQEVFLRLVRAGPEFHDDEHAKAWLLKVTARCAADLFRSPWRKRTEPLDEHRPAAAEPESGGVLEAVLALPPNYRVPIHLFYYEGMSVSEIAAALGKREDAVRTRLSRGRAMLRDALKGGVEDV